MKWNEFRKIAEKRGWILARHGANHDIYLHPEDQKMIYFTSDGMAKRKYPKEHLTKSKNR